jgi:crotonobetainyl-CoA:carnitine CoA-transferase CaiB-like acyl-CoA transferase
MKENKMTKLPLDGIRVLDFGQMWAGPHVTQWLSVAGAEVIKIETSLKIDFMRNVGIPATVPVKERTPNHGSAFASLNYGKKSLTLNMNQPRSKELFKQLVKISDVVAENFGGAVMDRWGLGYGDLKQVKSDIILYAGSGYGRTGPHSERPSYAEIVEAFDGSSYMNGYPGGEPNTVGVAPWMDAGQAQHGAFAILCALYHREQTGEGQQIDAAMIEGSANFLGELLMDTIMNDRVGERTGNRDSVMAPHGCYRCRGEYGWVAIAVGNDTEWDALCATMGNPPWTRQPEFSSQFERGRNQDILDKHLEEWTRERDAYQITAVLQGAGVMAGPSLGPKGLVDDPHLKERGFFVENDHPVIGRLIYAGLPFRLSNAPRGNYGPSPLLGEHNDYVLGHLLGLPREEIEGLVKDKVLL